MQDNSKQNVVNYFFQVGTGNKLLVVGCESGLVICAHIGKREEIFNKQLETPCNACIFVNNAVIVGCSDGQVIKLQTILKQLEWLHTATFGSTTNTRL